MKRSTLIRYCKESVDCRPLSDDFAKLLLRRGVKRVSNPKWFVRLARDVKNKRVSLRHAKKRLVRVQSGGFIATLASVVIPELVEAGWDFLKKGLALRKEHLRRIALNKANKKKAQADFRDYNANMLAALKKSGAKPL